MSSFLNISVLVLATMVLVLAGMVGYLYWQQNKLLRTMASLSGFVQSQFTPPLAVEHEHEHEPESEGEPQAQAEPEAEEDSDEEDDRASVELVDEVKQEVQIPEVSTQPPEDLDDLQSKTAPQLRELLNKRGIPFGKRDSKSVLLELLKASS
jgi:hypothetical protein